MLLRTLKDNHLVNNGFLFDYYPYEGTEIYVDPFFGCWRLDMIRSYPEDYEVELYSNEVLMGSYTWDDDLDVKVINSIDYNPLPSNGISPAEMYEDNKVLTEYCNRMNRFYVPKTRTSPPRFKN